MVFDAFCAKVGFDEYIGKTEYDKDVQNNDKDYDGNWGIFDEPFMQYVANRITRDIAKTPFFSIVYTLTSHDPFTVPKAFEGHFSKGTLPPHKTVGYTDYALRRFFETCRTKAWFENTLFIITSDHSTFVENDYYSSSLGRMGIPMIWYFPKQVAPKKESKIMQQIDIMPSLLHYLGYSKPFIAFGQSVFDTTAIPYAMRLSGSDYQFVENGFVLNFTDGKSVSLKKDQHDFAKSPNLMEHEPGILKALENKTKAMIQQYNSRVIHNQFVE
jgi:phosphoglycerol transferase MdoB-like AlkP superfamily enzyme